MSDAAACAKHPALPAIAVCTRCGAFSCDGCRVFVKMYDGPVEVCADCQHKVRFQLPTSPLSNAAAAIALFGWLPGLGFVGFALGVVELRRIKRGASTRSSEGFAAVAVLVGLLNGVATAVAIASYFSRR
jgi:hypothetical protein